MRITHPRRHPTLGAPSCRAKGKRTSTSQSKRVWTDRSGWLGVGLIVACLMCGAAQAQGILGIDPSRRPLAITIQGSSLTVAEGKTLSAVGGDITIVGSDPLTADSAPTLGAPGGRIQLASVASPGEVVFSPLELAPDLRVDSFTRLGRLALSQGAFLDASGNGGGSVLLRSGRLRVDGAWIFADNNGSTNGMGLGVDLQVAADAVITNQALLTADSLGTGRARDLRLTAGSVQIDNSTVASRALEGSRGNAGSIAVQAGRLTLTGGAQIDSGTRGAGLGGHTTVVANDALSLDGGGSGLFSQASSGSGGNAGSIAVQAGRLTLTGGAVIDSSTFSSGDAGRLSLATPLLTMDAGLLQTVADLDSHGNASGIDLRVGRLTLTGGAQIGSGSLGTGRGGNVTVVATDGISISGSDSKLYSVTSGSGDAGRLSLSTPLLTMNGGAILAGTEKDSHGNAGEISVEAGKLMLTGGATISGLAVGSGKGGSVTVSARESVSIAGHNDQANPSNITSFAAGDPGGLSLSAPTVTIDGGVVGTPSLAVEGFIAGAAGNTSVKADNLILSGRARIITSTISDSAGGNITIETGRLTLNGGAEILSGSGLRDQTTGTIVAGRGAAGDITVAATESVSLMGQNSGLTSGDLGQWEWG
jgi:hypothetical protein